MSAQDYGEYQPDHDLRDLEHPIIYYKTRMYPCPLLLIDVLPTPAFSYTKKLLKSSVLHH